MTLEELYRENYRIVYGYLLSLCADPALAEDLASETFLRAMQRPGRYDGRSKPSTWLCTIAKNLYFSELRRQRHHVPIPEEAALPADTAPFEERFADQETARAILGQAKALAGPYREVFFQRLAGLSFKEIGGAQGRTETWARVTFFRAKTTLLNELEEP